MAKRYLWLTTLVPLVAFAPTSASACKVVGYANGEPLCATTSDSHGYVDGRSPAQKHIDHIKTVRAREPAHRHIKNQGWSW